MPVDEELDGVGGIGDSGNSTLIIGRAAWLGSAGVGVGADVTGGGGAWSIGAQPIPGPRLV